MMPTLAAPHQAWAAQREHARALWDSLIKEQEKDGELRRKLIEDDHRIQSAARAGAARDEYAGTIDPLNNPS